MNDAIDLNGKSILVTGGTGSFGQRFIKTVLRRYKVRRIAVFSRDELKQFEMAQAPDFVGRPEIRFFIGDVRDIDRLEMAMREVDVVVHAAALKHVPAAEYNPFECIRTNVMGAENVVQAALRCRVQNVVALSTDKAAGPINLYGASKLASDKIFIAANHLSGSIGTRFAVVRYGNVLGSRGSVVPTFKRLIEQGANDLPITHVDMTRFWITLQEGVDFVLSSAAMMHGGEIFVPKLPSMRTVDLAKVMAPNKPIREIGIRPGEKLHETLITEDDARTTLEYNDRFVINPPFHFWNGTPKPTTDAHAVPEGFLYDSKTNPDQLTPDRLRSMLREFWVC